MKALQERLDNFTVLDKSRTPVGDVRNLVLHHGQLALVIVQPDVHRHWRFVLLSCHLVERISLRDRVVHVRTTQADMSYLPEHGTTHASVNYTSEANYTNGDNPTNGAKEQLKAIAPAQQVPAPLDANHTQHLELAKKTASGWLSAQKGALQPSVAGKESSPQDAPATPKVLASAMRTTTSQSSHLAHRADPKESDSMPFASKRASGYPQNGQLLKLQPEAGASGSIALLESAPTKVTTIVPSQPPIVKGKFTSPKQASQLLEAIAKSLSHRCKTIRIEIELDDPVLQGVCQAWLNQYMAMPKR